MCACVPTPTIAKGHKIAKSCHSCKKLWHCHKTKSFRGETVCRAEAHLKVKRKVEIKQICSVYTYVKKCSTLFSGHTS